MNTDHLFLLLSMMLIASNLMTSCALQPQVSDEAVSEEFADTSADKVFKKLRTEYSQAESSGLSFFADQAFRQGRSALRMAANLRHYKADDKDVLKHLYVAEKQLNLCRRVKALAEKQIPDVLDGLEQLKRDHVQQSYGSEFDAALWNTGKLLSYLEDTAVGKPADAAAANNFDKDKQKLLSQLHELKIKVVKFNALNDSLTVFKEVEKLGGKHLAPKTFQQAEKTLQDAGDTIENNMNDDAAVAEARQRYAFAVYHALHVSRAVDKLRSLHRSEYEDYVLDLENNLQPIAQAFHYQDIRNHPLREQMQLLTGLARRLAAQKSGPGQPKLSISDSPEFNELKNKYQDALKKIQQLNDTITQWRQKNPQAKIVLSKQAQKSKQRVSQLEEQVSQLLLENNNLKAERDSLQSKLDTMVGKK